MNIKSLHIAAYDTSDLGGDSFLYDSVYTYNSFLAGFFFQISGVIWDFSIIFNLSPVSLGFTLMKIIDDDVTIFLVSLS